MKACSRALLLLLAVSFLSSCHRSSEQGLGPGNLAPAFALEDLLGQKRSLADYQGKVVVLTFWASWCGTCLSEMPDLEKLYQSLKDRGLETVSIGSDDRRENFLETSQRLGLTFPILLDPDGSAKPRYKVQGFPESFVLNREGKLQMVIDPEGRKPTVRIIGARPWNDPFLRAQIEKLLG